MSRAGGHLPEVWRGFCARDWIFMLFGNRKETRCDPPENAIQKARSEWSGPWINLRRDQNGISSSKSARPPAGAPPPEPPPWPPPKLPPDEEPGSCAALATAMGTRSTGRRRNCRHRRLGRHHRARRAMSGCPNRAAARLPWNSDLHPIDPAICGSQAGPRYRLSSLCADIAPRFLPAARRRSPPNAIRCALALARGAVTPSFEVAMRRLQTLPPLGRAHFGIAPEVPNDDDLIYRTRHGASDLELYLKLSI